MVAHVARFAHAVHSPDGIAHIHAGHGEGGAEHIAQGAAARHLTVVNETLTGNARLLADILRRMNGMQVEIEADEHLLCHIRSGEAVFDIMGMAAADFPEMPSVAEGEKIELDGELYKCRIE